jgi:integrase
MTAAGSWQDALLASARMAERERPRARSVLAGLARFAARRGIPAVPGCLLDWDVIEAFCVAGLAGRASSTRGTYRSVLYQLAAPVRGKPACRATPFAGARAPAPYSPAERAELAAIACAQRGPAMRASALAMVVFGIGAGLRPGELVALPGDDIFRHGRQVIVQVSGQAPVATRGTSAGSWPRRADATTGPQRTPGQDKDRGGPRPDRLLPARHRHHPPSPVRQTPLRLRG